MGWTYSQSTGKINHNGTFIGRGYSGKGAGKNNPSMQHVRAEGPVTMKLTPIGHNALGRTLFRIHGDNQRMNFTASEGCIILSRSIREKIANSDDTRLNVIY